MKEALFYEKSGNKQVTCLLCPHNCIIEEGKVGKCRVRVNQHGILYTNVYGLTSVQHVNAIEKKPLYHFHPGSKTYSIATFGCNFKCSYCINWQLSQTGSNINDTIRNSSPKEIVQTALLSKCESIAYTYVEPTIFFEYAYDIAREAHGQGLKNVFKTNGFMNLAPLELLSPYMDAANVDLKTFSNHTYQKLGGRLTPVLDFLKKAKALGIWLEVTTVLIPGVNDSELEIEQIAGFIARELGKETPWHLCRFFPAYKMETTQPTSLSTLEKAYQVGRTAGLHYVYFGNLPIPGKQDTYCPACRQKVIVRKGFDLTDNKLVNSTCPNCHFEIAGTGLQTSNIIEY